MGWWALTAVAAAAAALAAWRLGALDGSGAMAAGVTGWIVYGWGGLGAAALLSLFFLSASALTRWGAGTTAHKARGIRQVLANGAVPAIAVLGGAVGAAPWWDALFAGALAAVTADTWATELGRRFGRRTVLITTGRPVAKGRSGGVSLWGTLGGAVGAGVMALAAGAIGVQSRSGGLEPGSWATRAAVVMAAGVVGLFLDSLLGAAWQGRFFCPICRTETESRIHRCGAPAVFVKGLPWLDNDMVNFITSLSGGIVAAVLYGLL